MATTTIASSLPVTSRVLLRSIVLSFFESAQKELYDCYRMISFGDNDDDDDDDDDENDSTVVEDCRRILLNTQRRCLQSVVDEYNNNTNNKNNNNNRNNSEEEVFTVEMVQKELKRLKRNSTTTTVTTTSSNTNKMNKNTNKKDDNVNNNNNDDDEEGEEEEKKLQLSMEHFDSAVRLSFCRLVLYYEYMQEREGGRKKNPMKQLKKKKKKTKKKKTWGSMEKSEILEFCGLCNGIVQLDFVKKHLAEGTPLFPKKKDSSSSSSSSNVVVGVGVVVVDDNDVDDDDDDEPIPMFPTKRLEKIQKLLMGAIGYDAEYGIQELKRIFFTNPPNDDFRNDTYLMQTFTETTENMMKAVHMANESNHMEAQHGTTMYSDQDSGGVTRVVSVHYSEKLLDPNQNIDHQLRTLQMEGASSSIDHSQQQQQQQPIQPQCMETHREQQQKQQLQIAKDTMNLQQQILQELQSLSIQDREQTLLRAKMVEEQFLQQAMQIPPGPQRIAFLRDIDPSTQKLLAMKRIWEATQP